MPIPKEILAVERPSNTVAQAEGKNKDRYAVKQRIGCRRVGGRNIPINGKAPFRPWNSRKGAAGQKKAWKTQKELYIVLLVWKVLIKKLGNIK